MRTLLLLSAFAIGLAGANEDDELAAGLEIIFGDDSSAWAFDDVCDDNRFTGEPLHYYHWSSGEHNAKDATDCRTLFAQGQIKWRPKGDEDQALLDAARDDAAILEAAEAALEAARAASDPD